MSTVPADLSGKSDAELIAEVRSGKIASYGTLYERHTGAAHNLARQLARSSSEADDLVSEAFAKVLTEEGYLTANERQTFAMSSRK